MITAEQRQEIVRQIGRMNVMSISGGRVRAIENGVELPVSNGYKVRVHLSPSDTYVVERVFSRGLKEWIKGSRSEVYCHEVGQAAYYASCFQSYEPGEWEVKV